MNKLLKITLLGILLSTSAISFGLTDSSKGSKSDDALNSKVVTPDASNDVVAKLNGGDFNNVSITEKQIADFFDKNAQAGYKYMDLPQNAKSEIIKRYVERSILMQKVKSEAIKESAEFKNMLSEIQDELAINLLSKKYLEGKVSDSDVQKKYDEIVAQLKDSLDVKFSFIKVATEDVAKKVAAELKAKKKFTDLVKQYSTDEKSKESGGSVKEYVNTKMIPAFESSLTKLKRGESSAPIQMGDAWFIIKVEDKKPSQAPSYEQLAPRIEQELKEIAARNWVDSLSSSITITYPQDKADSSQPSSVSK